MKASAIVYEANNDYSKKYAQYLSEETGLTAYDLKQAKAQLKKNTEVVYIGWVMDGKVEGYRTAARRYFVEALAAVGVGRSKEKVIIEIIEKYTILKMPVFYLQGGYDKSKMHGVRKLIMNKMEKMLSASLDHNIEPASDIERTMMDIIKKGTDLVKKENLNEILAWIK